MEFVTALVGAGVPALLWLWFFYSRDRYDPEPKSLIARLFVLGAFPVVIAAGILNTIFLFILTGGDPTAAGGAAIFVLAVFVAPLTEEPLKYLGAAAGSSKHHAFDEPVDGMIYGTTVGLGFAAAETVDYLIAAQMGVTPFGTALEDCFGLACLVQTAILRGLGSALLHAMAGGIAGHFLSRRRLFGAGWGTVWGGILLAAVLHGLWNFVNFLSLPITIAIYVLLFRRNLALSPFRRPTLQLAHPQHPPHPHHYVPPPAPGQLPYGGNFPGGPAWQPQQSWHWHQHGYPPQQGLPPPQGWPPQQGPPPR